MINLRVSREYYLFIIFFFHQMTSVNFQVKFLSLCSKSRFVFRREIHNIIENPPPPWLSTRCSFVKAKGESFFTHGKGDAAAFCSRQDAFSFSAIRAIRRVTIVDTVEATAAYIIGVSMVSFAFVNVHQHHWF
ncbi:hypothetical protein ACI65C_001105 [Semiaphis heraclei]